MDRTLDKIIKAQEDPENLIILLNDFRPLLKKYARKLNYEDAYYDMQVLFIEMIFKIKADNFPKEDKYVLSYIAKGAYNIFLQCLAQQKYKHYETLNSEIEENHLNNIEAKCSFKDSYDELLLDDLRKVLTDKEYQVMNYYLMEQRSVQEISVLMGISKQAVFAKKKNAISKLQKYF